MHTAGFTGGIGSGKSAVSRLLGEHGAVVVDADLVAREVVDAFGPEVLPTDGGLARAWLGRRVFCEPQALARLDGITPPLIVERTRELLRQALGSGAPCSSTTSPCSWRTA